MTTEDNKAIIRWETEDIVDFKGFRIYRAVDDSVFRPSRDFPADQYSFTDSGLVNHKWYYYRISVLGYGVESLLSKPVKLMAGPGKIWILSRYGYNIRRLSYDLLHNNDIFYTNYPAIEWDFDKVNRFFWLAHAQFYYISRMNLNIGQEDFFYRDKFQRPIDIKTDFDSDRIFILDAKKKRIYVMIDNAVQDSISVDHSDFFAIQPIPFSRIAAMDSSGLLIFNSTKNIVKEIEFSSEFIGQDIYYSNEMLYVLSASLIQNASEIIILNTSDLSQNSILTNGYYTLIRTGNENQNFWMAQYLSSDSYQAVKLSSDGKRQLQISVSDSQIDDLQINPYDKSIVIVQRYLDKITLYDSTGSFISVNSQIYDPIKVNIE
ncbi:MAG: hypothetical protein JXL67_07665 [Calditrichaeota bacterium]|nr:hypothetical protein [Calditrichota bacterium]